MRSAAFKGGPLTREYTETRARWEPVMGGDLRTAPAGKSPTFLVAALKDLLSGNLDRYQIVKGWMDAKSDLHEKVYDVVWSGDRKPGKDGKLPPGGAERGADDHHGAGLHLADLVHPLIRCAPCAAPFCEEQKRLNQAREADVPRRKWGRYPSERQWWTVLRMGPGATPAHPLPWSVVPRTGARDHVSRRSVTRGG